MPLRRSDHTSEHASLHTPPVVLFIAAPSIDRPRDGPMTKRALPPENHLLSVGGLYETCQVRSTTSSSMAQSRRRPLLHPAFSSRMNRLGEGTDRIERATGVRSTREPLRTPFFSTSQSAQTWKLIVYYRTIAAPGQAFHSSGVTGGEKNSVRSSQRRTRGPVRRQSIVCQSSVSELSCIQFSSSRAISSSSTRQSPLRSPTRGS